MWRRWGSGTNSSIISVWGRSRGSRKCRSNNGYSSNRHGRRALWLAAAAVVGAALTTAVGGAGAATTAVSGPGLDPPAGGGEE